MIPYQREWRWAVKAYIEMEYIKFISSVNKFFLLTAETRQLSEISVSSLLTWYNGWNISIMQTSIDNTHKNIIYCDGTTASIIWVVQMKVHWHKESFPRLTNNMKSKEHGCNEIKHKSKLQYW